VEGLSRSNTELKSVLELIRKSSGVESDEIMRRIREAPTLDDAVTAISNAALLLQGQSNTAFVDASHGSTNHLGAVQQRGFAVAAEPPTPREARLGSKPSSGRRLMSRYEQYITSNPGYDLTAC
jgi:hypothetical protein